MRNTKTFIRENKEIVLLICDFYETKQIPSQMTMVKKNLSLFPVANIPMIEYVLSSLCDQKLFSVILAGKDCESVASYVKEIEFAKKMNITSLNCEGSSLGDLMRHIDDNGFEFGSLLVVYANHYTNYPLRSLLDKHKENKSFMTLFVHPNESNSKVSHLYGFRDEEIVFYDRCVNENHSKKKVLDTIEAQRTVEFVANLSSPTIAAVSSAVFPLFTENFDFGTLGDLVEGVLAFNAYNLKIMCCRQSEDMTAGVEHLGLKQGSKFYSREIVTLYDYFKFNEDVRGGKAVDLLKFKHNNSEILRNFVQVQGNFFFGAPDVELHEPISNTVIGHDLKFKRKYSIKDSVVGHGCLIEGNIDRCIIWDDLNVRQDFMDHIVFSDGGVVHYNHLEVEAEEQYEPKKETSFFDDVLSYLWSVVGEDLYEIDINDVTKQISLLRIVWNASELDLIEAFSMFLVEMIDSNDVEGSMINASMFFPVLYGRTKGKEEQETLMELLVQGLSDSSYDVRRELVLRYGYLLFEDGLVSRSTLKKYSSKLKE